MLSPDPLVLAPRTTTQIDVCYRPLVVGGAAGKLLLDSPELGPYEWGLQVGPPAGREGSKGRCTGGVGRERVGLGSGGGRASCLL